MGNRFSLDYDYVIDWTFFFSKKVKKTYLGKKKEAIIKSLIELYF